MKEKTIIFCLLPILHGCVLTYVLFSPVEFEHLIFEESGSITNQARYYEYFILRNVTKESTRPRDGQRKPGPC